MISVNRININNFKHACKSMGINPKTAFHGINPSSVIEGERYVFPRFCSVEMQTAVKMNKNVLQKLRTIPDRTYPKATAEDLRRLTSDTIEDSFARVEWTNPKDGKIYNILKQGETQDGKVAVRILDKDGGFVKEAELTPKVIGINDKFSNIDESGGFGLSHGDLCLTYAKRNNPFARYVTFDTSLGEIASGSELRDVNSYLKKGGKLDYLSCSYGADCSTTTKVYTPNQDTLFLELVSPYDALIRKYNTRILVAGSNKKPNEVRTANEISNRILVMNSKVEGVGSINPETRRISDFSLSRNSELTQHYEVGEYTPYVTKNGLNITGLSGTDISCKNRYLQSLQENPLIGKSVDRVQKLKSMLEARIKELIKEHYNIMIKDKTTPFAQKFEKMQRVDDAKYVNEIRRAKLLDYTLDLKAEDGTYVAKLDKITGTSLSTPIRTAKLALNDMLDGIL